MKATLFLWVVLPPLLASFTSVFRLPASSFARGVPRAVQDSVDARLKELSSDDIAVREAAAKALLKLPYEDLPKLLPAIESGDVEVAGRAREIAEAILLATFGETAVRFECAAVAPPEVFEAWDKDGADPKKPPKGFRCLPGDGNQGTYTRDRKHLLVAETPTITNADVRETSPQPTRVIGYWQVDYKLSDEGAAKFDAAAAVLFKQKEGLMAFVVDGKIDSMPRIMAEKFGVAGVLAGGYTKERAQELAQMMLGRWSRLNLVVKAADKEALAKIAKAVPGTAGMEEAKVEAVEGGLKITGPLDAKRCDFASFWLAVRKAGGTLETSK